MLKYFAIGLLFGMALYKGEAVYWSRMQEMFHFQGFQIFGIFFTAIPTAFLGTLLIKRMRKSEANKIVLKKKVYSAGIIYGSALFGIGWGLTGACPGPIYIQIAGGSMISLAILLSALLGTWSYAFLRERLPH